MYRSRPLRWYDAITINIYFFGLTTLAQTMTPLVIPLLVQRFVGQEQQGTFYGNIRLWTLMTALLVQSLMGLVSDRSTSRFGRRRPFILFGTIANLAVIAAIGFSAGLEGITGYWFLFAMLILLMIFANTSQAAAQGLIPDLVPENQRGRFSGVKALFEVPIPLILVAFTIGRLIAAGNYWAALLITMSILFITMLITMLAPEKPAEKTGQKIDWTPFFRLMGMAAIFTLIILTLGSLIKLVSANLTGFNHSYLLAIMGLSGLSAMLVAIGFGVWASIRIGIGYAAEKNPSFSWWVINRLAFLVGVTNLASFAVFFLQGRLGLDNEQAAGPASSLIMYIGIAILILAIPGGWLSDRFGPKALVVASGIIASFGTLILLFAFNLAMIYFGGILVGVATGIFYTSNWALGTDLIPLKEAGRYLGISNLAGAGAGAVGAFIGGPIADYFTTNVPEISGLGYTLLFTIYGALFLFSVFAALRINLSPSQKVESIDL